MESRVFLCLHMLDHWPSLEAHFHWRWFTAVCYYDGRHVNCYYNGWHVNWSPFVFRRIYPALCSKRSKAWQQCSYCDMDKYHMQYYQKYLCTDSWTLWNLMLICFPKFMGHVQLAMLTCWCENSEQDLRWKQVWGESNDYRQTLITEPLLTSGVEALVAFIILPTLFTLHYSGRNISNMECHCDPPTTDRHEEARQY